MNRIFSTLRDRLHLFARKDDGTATFEIMLVLPAFFILFLSAYEGGMVSMRHVMLERGVDMAVRDVRIGRMKEPTHTQLKLAICEYAGIIPQCIDNLQLEMVRMDIRSWSTALDGPIRCVDRALTVQPAVQFTNGGNNELMVLQVCSLFDPVSQTSGWGQYALGAKIPKKSQGGYALVASSAFVMEPYQ